MRKQVVSQTLDLLSEVAKDRPEDYQKFWSAFGAVLKEGLYFEPEYKDKIAKLVRYESVSEGKLIGLAYSFEQATHLRRPPASTPPLAGDPGPVKHDNRH